MKGKAALLALTAMALASDGNSRYYEPIERESPQERELRLKKAHDKQMKAKGLKEFSYGTNKVWALNQKTADKKAIKLGYIPF